MSARIPIVVSAAFAERNGLEFGAEVDVRFAGTGRYLLGEVSSIVPAVPTAGRRLGALEADLGVIFMHNQGYSDMCGHGVIALATVAVAQGLVPRSVPEVDV